MSKLASYLKQRLPEGMAYPDAATLCIRLYLTVSGVTENLCPLTKEVIADAFAELTKSGWVNEVTARQPHTPSAGSHENTDRGHWIEIIISSAPERYDFLRGEELARLAGFIFRP